MNPLLSAGAGAVATLVIGGLVLAIVAMVHAILTSETYHGE